MSEQNNLHLTLTAQIVSAHVSNNSIPPDGLPNLIKQVMASLKSSEQPEVAEVKKLEPAVPIKKSVFPDYIVCLEDGKKLKMLKRHLHNEFNMTPDQYRARWGLASDYPMVCPNYSSHRSALAKKVGLGRKNAAPAVVSPPSAPVRSVSDGKKPGRRSASQEQPAA